MRPIEQMYAEIFDATAMPDDPLALAIREQMDAGGAVIDEWHSFEAARRHEMFLQANKRNEAN
jgi:hypothetical protein